MQLGLQQRFVGQLGVVLRNECGRCRSAQGVLNHFVVLAGAEQHAQGRILMRLADVAIQCLQIKTELAQVFGLEAPDLQFDGNEAVQPAVEKQQIQREVLLSDLDRELRSDEAEVTS